MNDKAAQRALGHLTIAELEILDRVAKRYARAVSEHATLIGVMNLAVRTRNWMLFAKTKEQAEQAVRRCNESYCALQVVRQELNAHHAAGPPGLTQAEELSTAPSLGEESLRQAQFDL